MKKLLHFLLFIAGLTLCACTSESNNDDGFDPLSGYNKKFDFSNIDTEGLFITGCWGDYDSNNNDTATYPIRELWGKDYVVILGKRDDTYAWIGVFDYFTHKCIYDYTDWGKPVGYTEYGEEVKYEITTILPDELTFGDDYFTIPITYSDKRNRRTEIDLVIYRVDGTTTRNKVLDTASSHYDGYINTGKLSNNCLFFYSYDDMHENSSIIIWFYEIPSGNKFYEFTLNSLDGWIPRPPTTAFDIIGAAFATADYTQSRILINPNDVESWLAYTSPGQTIKLVAYDHGELSDVQEVVIFDEYTGSYDQAPRYAVEYLEQEADSHLLKVTRTEYNGTRESKKVRIYIYDNEYNIKIE